MKKPDEKNRMLALMLAPARERLAGRDVGALCANAAVTFDSERNELLLPSMGEVVRVRLPDYEIAQDLDMWRHLTLLQYLDAADGAPLTGTGISLGEMRGGLSRGPGFDRDISLMVARGLRGASARDVALACEALGGTLVPERADVCAVIPYAPRFPGTFRCWRGDEEFPPSGKTLVDAAAEHYLALEAAGGACVSVVQAIVARCGGE